jgi:hypothetical protein
MATKTKTAARTAARTAAKTTARTTGTRKGPGPAKRATATRKRTRIHKTTDAKGRVCLPKGFANSTIVIEQVSESELRVRKAKVIPVDELEFTEQRVAPLSDRDRDIFLALLDNPPEPNEALREAVKEYDRQHG